MKLNIKAEEIMNQNFPLLDSSLTLETCVRRLNKNYEACVILNDGFINSVVSYDDLLKAFLKRKNKDSQIKEIKPNKNFAVVSSETDVFDIINLMNKNNIDFIIVHDWNNLGLITKREITEINQLLFDRLIEEKEFPA